MADWKSFRQSLPAMGRAEQLEAVARYWSQAPLEKLAYDVFELDTIPGAWDMISAGNWCRDSVAVGMEFTLRLAGWASEEMSLLFVRDYDISDQMLVLKIESGETLNYSVGEVTDFPDTRHDIMFGWRHTGRGYSSI